MQKKILILSCILLLNVSVSNASTNVKVTAEEAFSTLNPAKTMDFKVQDNVTLGNYNLSQGDILHCNIVKIKKPKRGKISAGFDVQLTSYTTNGVQNDITELYKGKYAKTVLAKDSLKEIDKAKVVKKTAVAVGTHFVKAIGPAISLTEGVIKNEEGGRIKSGIKQVYKDSPVSYVEKGQELNLQAGDQFFLVFKDLDDDDDLDEE